MVAKRCYRTLDKPITVFGLEMEDLLGLVAAAGAVLFLVGPLPGVAAGLAGWAGLRALKAGKPPGYVAELLYRKGLFNLVPLLAPVHLLPYRARIRFSPVRGGDDPENPIEKTYWGGVR